MSGERIFSKAVESPTVGPFDEFLDGVVVTTRLDSRGFWQATGGAVNPLEQQQQQVRLPYDPSDLNSMAAWTLSRLKNVIARLQQPQQCKHCETVYLPLNNLGSWACRWHPGAYENGRYSCCGTINYGCQRCDHTPMQRLGHQRWTEANRTIRVPVLLQRLLKWQPEAITLAVPNDDDPARTYYRLTRVSPRSFKTS